MKPASFLAGFVVFLMVFAFVPTNIASAVTVDDVWVDPDKSDEDYTYDTIQEAIDAVDADGTVHVEQGEYEEDIVIDKDGLTVVSTEEHGAVIKGRVEIRADNVILQGFVIERQEDNGPGIEIFDHDRIFIQNNIIDGKDVPGSSTSVAGIQIRYANVSIFENKIKNHAGNGIWVDAGGDITIDANELINNRTGINFNSSSDTALTEIRITDNTFDGNSAHGISIGVAGNLVNENFTIKRNTFENAGRTHFSDRRYAAKDDIDPAPGRADFLGENVIVGEFHWHWDESGTRWKCVPGFMSVVAEDPERYEFDSIQEAIDAADVGGKIYVYPGTYEEGGNGPGENISLHIHVDGIKLQGVDSDGVPIYNHEEIEGEIVGLNAGSDSEHSSTSYFVDADGVEIIGLLLRPHSIEDTFGELTFYSSAYALYITGNKFTMQHSIVELFEDPEVNGYDSITDTSLGFVGPNAEEAVVSHNVLYGSVAIREDAGGGKISITNNKIIGGMLESPALHIREAHLPEFSGNEVETVDYLGFDIPALLAYPASDYDGDNWLFDVAEGNIFCGAYAIASAETLEPKTDDSNYEDFYILYSTFGYAASEVEDGELILVFHPSVFEGTTFDSGLMDEGAYVAMPTSGGGPVVVMPKGFFPQDGDYTFTASTPEPPADLPEGYELLNSVAFILESDGRGLTEYGDDEAEIWLMLPPKEDPEAPPAEMLERVAIFRYDEADEEWVKLDIEYDEDRNIMVATTDQFSFFAFMLEIETYTVTFEESEGLEPTIEIAEEGSDSWTEVEDGAIDLENGDYQFRATLEGYEDYEGNFEVAGEDKLVEFTMEAEEEETPETGTGIMWLIPFGLLVLAGGVFIRRKVLA